MNDEIKKMINKITICSTLEQLEQLHSRVRRLYPASERAFFIGAIDLRMEQLLKNSDARLEYLR